MLLAQIRSSAALEPFETGCGSMFQNARLRTACPMWTLTLTSWLPVERGGEATHTCVICRDSWLPRRMVMRSRYRTFSATSRLAVSTEWYLQAV